MIHKEANFVTVVAIFRGNLHQMNKIAGSNPKKGRSVMVNEYEDLNNIIADQVRKEFCPEGSSSSFKLVGNQCEKNECLVNNGGCQEIFLTSCSDFLKILIQFWLDIVEKNKKGNVPQYSRIIRLQLFSWKSSCQRWSLLCS